MCCGPWGCKESDTTEGLNGTECNHNDVKAPSLSNYVAFSSL